MEQAYSFTWTGDRISNKEPSAEAALQILLEFLRKREDGSH
jgi:hypothetical protein